MFGVYEESISLWFNSFFFSSPSFFSSLFGSLLNRLYVFYESFTV